VTLVCPECFGEKGLKRRIEGIRPGYDEGPCDFHPRRKGVPVEAVAAIVDEVFRNNYGFSETEAFFSSDPDDDRIYHQPTGTDFRETVESLTKPSEDGAFDALCSQLIAADDYWPPDGGEAFYSEDAHYGPVRASDGGNGLLWQRFCQDIVHRRRFFNDDARGALATIFRNVHLLQDLHRNPAVYMLAPDEAGDLHRARIVDEAELQKISDDPVGRMGAAPPKVGRANRMNPSGVRAFYGSFDQKTCLSELRPLVGDRVAVATFRLRRPVCVLDLTRFGAGPKELNVFAKDHARRLAQWRFMQRFMSEIARPILKSDEHLDYVPTQAVAEFLAHELEVHVGGNERRIEAVIYTSAQRSPGRNIVLLGHAALAEASDAAVRKAAKTLPPSSFELNLLKPTIPPDPGISLAERSLVVLSITGAEFTPGDAAGLRDVINPAF